MNDNNKTLKPVIDGTKPGYEDDIATKPEQFFGVDNPLPDDVEETAVAISGLPDKNGHAFVRETPLMHVGGVRVIYRHVPALLFNTARSMLRKRMSENKPQAQEFIADNDGTRVLGDQNPAYLESLEIWQKEWDEINTMVSTGVSLFSGLVLVDGMPADDTWMPMLKEMFEGLGLDFDAMFNSYLYDKDKLKELYYKQYVVLAKTEDANAFTEYQSDGNTSTLPIVSEVEAASMFRT